MSGRRKHISRLVCAALASVFTLSADAKDVGSQSSATGNDWPALVKPAADAPSILLIMTDDVGFGASSTFGGPIGTPVFDALARGGLRYTQMTTTGICSPSRAALLTGRNHNSVNMGNVVDVSSGFEGFTGDIPKSAATGARLLRDAGYATAMFGKAHITPIWERGPTGPFDRWPTGLGFGHFYGFLGGDTNQWVPALYSDNSPVETPGDQPDYILDRDLADKAVQWVRRSSGANPDKPVFLYYAPGTAHAPHHAPPEWIAKFRGRFDKGWDAVREETLARQKASGIVPSNTRLAARPAAIPAWNRLTKQQQRIYAHQMEVYAASLAYADHQIGRVVEAMRKHAGGNLLVVYVQGDNGASAEAGLNGSDNEHALFQGVTPSLDELEARIPDMGGPATMNHFSMGWAFAMNAPFPWVKQLASHFGATRNGVVISWPDRIKQVGTTRSQFHHIIDIMPTLLEAAQVKMPQQVDGVRQQPMDGISLSYTFGDRAASSHRHTQYYEVWDNVGIYHDGWYAGSVPRFMPWVMNAGSSPKEEAQKWELFDLKRDFSQSTNVAQKYPEKLTELKALFEVEAKRYSALPVHRFEGMANRPDYNAGRTRFVFHGPTDRIPEEVAPPIATRSFDIAANVKIAAGKDSGTLLAVGGRFGGLSWYLKEGRPVFRYNMMGAGQTNIVGDVPLKAGEHRLGLHFRRGAKSGEPATVEMTAGGAMIAQGSVPDVVYSRFSLDESFDVGSDTGTPVAPAEYSSPNPFSGELRSLEVKVRPANGPRQPMG